MEGGGIFYGRLVYLTAIFWPFGIFWPIGIFWPFGIFGPFGIFYSVYFFPLWYFVPRKIWQPCSGVDFVNQFRLLIKEENLFRVKCEFKNRFLCA
jgi:hypothetical protein